MLDNLTPIVLHWALTSLSLWVASHVFNGIRFADTPALVVSALMLGLANAVVRPLLIILTLPLTLVTLGFFLLVINALMLLLVSALVRGFTISGFWTAFFAALFITVLSSVLGFFVDAPDAAPLRPSGHGRWVRSAAPWADPTPVLSLSYPAGRTSLPGKIARTAGTLAIDQSAIAQGQNSATGAPHSAAGTG